MSLYQKIKSFFAKKKTQIPDELADKPRSEWTLWEQRMFSGKNGQPVPIVSMRPKLVSHEECERALDKALVVKPAKLAFFMRFPFNFQGKEKTRNE